MRISCRKTETDEEAWLLDDPLKVEMSSEQEVVVVLETCPADPSLNIQYSRVQV
jgi:hypothetical protein